MANLRRRALIVETKIGRFAAEFSDRGLASLSFLGGGQSLNQTAGFRQPQLGALLGKELRRYAAGKRVKFSLPLDLAAGTPFQQKVWRALLTIPYGETRPYAWVARRIGKPRATRAVGAACGANPIGVIVPCHRVIASDGSLGGYTGGLTVKKRLLNLERGHTVA